MNNISFENDGIIRCHTLLDGFKSGNITILAAPPSAAAISDMLNDILSGLPLPTVYIEGPRSSMKIVAGGEKIAGLVAAITGSISLFFSIEECVFTTTDSKDAIRASLLGDRSALFDALISDRRALRTAERAANLIANYPFIFVNLVGVLDDPVRIARMRAIHGP